MSLLSMSIPCRVVSQSESLRFLKRVSLVLAVVAGLGTLTATAQMPGVTLTNNSPITIPSQQYGPLTVTVTPVGGFSGLVSLNCVNMPVYASCEFPNVNSGVNISGSAVVETFTVNTSQIYNYTSRTASPHEGMGRVALCTLFAPAAALLFFARKRRLGGSAIARLLLCVLVLYPLAGLAGCAAVKPMATPAGTYTFNVVGSYAATSASTVVTLKVT